MLPRIVLSGPVGAGKTTLAQALGERLGVPVLPESMKGIYDALGLHRSTRRQASAASGEARRTRDALMDTFFAWADERSRLYEVGQGFVADRWEADLLDLWLKLFSDTDCDPLTSKLLRDMRAKSRRMTLAIFVPMQRHSVEQRNSDGLTRRQSFTLKFTSTLITTGLLRQCPGLRTVTVPESAATVEQRVAYALEALDRASAPGSSLE